MDEQNVATTSSEELPRPRGRRRFQKVGGRRPEASATTPASGQTINMGELRELVSLIAAHGFTEFELEQEGFRVRLRREVNSAPVAAPPPPPAPPAVLSPSSAPTQTETPEEKSAAAEAELHLITSPIVGTFYRAPSPTAEPYVKVGSHVEPDTVVCIVEAMKLMNEIKAEVRGTVEKIYVENGQPVEYGQPLFGIRLD